MILVASLVGAFAWLQQADSKPGRCPNCSARSLIADRNGAIWRCVPCQAQYYWLGSELHRMYGHDRDAVPTATLRTGGVRDKVPK